MYNSNNDDYNCFAYGEYYHSSAWILTFSMMLGPYMGVTCDTDMPYLRTQTAENMRREPVFMCPSQADKPGNSGFEYSQGYWLCHYTGNSTRYGDHRFL